MHIIALLIKRQSDGPRLGFFPSVLKQKACNLIITPENYVDDIKKEVKDIGDERIRIVEVDVLYKMAVESLERKGII